MVKRPELGSPGRGLKVRMAIGLAINFALLGGIVALVTSPLFYGEWEAFLFGLWALGMIAIYVVYRALFVTSRSRDPAPREKERLRPIVERQCATLTLPPVDFEVERHHAPLSWTTALPFRRPTIYVTTGLIERLDEPGLRAAIAHELGHIANRDAVLMTIIAWPATVLWAALRGAYASWAEERFDLAALFVLAFAAVFIGPLAVLFTLAVTVVARHRELAADRAAAVITRSPAAVSAALLSVADGLARIPNRDLRVVGARDPFLFVPVREARGMRRLWATHPPVEVRMRELERLELLLQHG